MKYVNILLLLIISLNGKAQPSYKILHVKNALVISTYELDGNCFHHKGHTIKIDKKAYPFFVRSEQNIWILRNVFDVDSAECEQYEDMDFAYHVDKGIYNQDLYISDFEKGYVKGAQSAFNDYATPFFTNYDFEYSTSSSNLREFQGYQYARQNYKALTKGMKPGIDKFNFAPHSMGELLLRV